MNLDERVAVLESQVDGMCKDIDEMDGKLDGLIVGQTRIEEHLNNGLSKRIADEIEANREGKARRHNLMIAAIGVALVAVEIILGVV